MDEFDWDEHNEEHVRDHDVEPSEAEDAFSDPDALAVEAYNHDGEKRWAMLGTTEDGRLLFAVFGRRRSMIRIITARPATPRETRRYRKPNR